MHAYQVFAETWSAFVLEVDHPCASTEPSAEQRHIVAELLATVLSPAPRLVLVSRDACVQKWSWCWASADWRAANVMERYERAAPRVGQTVVDRAKELLVEHDAAKRGERDQVALPPDLLAAERSRSGAADCCYCIRL